MPITDLTGYTWVGNDNLTGDIRDSFYISFISNSTNFTSIDLLLGTYPEGVYYYHGYDGPPDIAYTFDDDFNFAWTNEAYKTIQITGGTDATNSRLIAWLEANGTLTAPTPTPTTQIALGRAFIKRNNQLVPVSVMRKVAGSGSAVVTDLTNTTWEFNATSTVMPGPIEPPSGTSLIGTLTTPDNTIINIVNYGPGEMSGDIILLDENDTVLEFTRAGAINKGKTLGTYTLHITSGTLTTNTNLINALTTYWTQVGGVSLQPLAIGYTSEAQATTYTITTSVTNGTYSGDTTIAENGTSTVTLSANSGYTLPSSITVSGASYTYNSTTGVVSLSNPTGNVTISATCVAPASPYLTFSSPSTFTLNVVDNTKYWDGTLEWSTDTTTWNTWAGTSAISSSSSGDTKYLYLRGSNNTYITGSSASTSKARWVLTGSNISCDGNIENLLDYQTVANGGHPTMAPHCFNGFVRNNTSLISTPALPATTLTDSCYRNMFRACSNLTTIMQTLPATTLANNCYRLMFQNCSSLTTAPSLPATTLASNCYNSMFQNCSSLTTAPALPATTLTEYCYQYMFDGCSSLTTAPTLPATTLIQYCYASMFSGCTSLIQAPELPAITLANSCYGYMFQNCSSLTTTQSLPAITLVSNCYSGMFYGCKALTTAPALPATTLADYCYFAMFSNCTSLTTPAIMASGTTQATPANSCCYQMYSGCTALNIYTSSSNHIAFYKAITYSSSSTADTNYRSTYRMFYDCKINGTTSTADYLTEGTQYYY